MGVIDMVSSVLTGGATGLIGVGLQRFAEYKNKQLEIEIELKKAASELEMRKADASIMAQEWAARTKVVEVQAEASASVAADQAFSQALLMEPKQYSQGITATPAQAWLMFILDFVRGFVRPGLTIYLCFITTVIYLKASGMVEAGMSQDRAYELVILIVNTVLYLTTTCVLFWFGTRNKQEAPRL